VDGVMRSCLYEYGEAWGGRWMHDYDMRPRYEVAGLRVGGWFFGSGMLVLMLIVVWRCMDGMRQR
jgi:hypothetical protein